MNKTKIEDFFKNSPLYKPFKIVENYNARHSDYNSPYSFQGQTFMYYCENEQDEKTFELELTKGGDNFWGVMDGDKIADVLFDSKGHLNFVEHFKGCCKSCKEYQIDMVLHVWSTNKIPRKKYHRLAGPAGTSFKSEYEDIIADIFIEKIGLFPQPEFKIDLEVKKHFDRETNNWYYKACECLKLNYGIGAFAYFRRIIEKELITIVKEISELEAADSKIKKLYEEYKTTNQVYSIYENIFEFLPKSLQSLGINPIKTLYSQTSEGLHSLNEEDCLNRATGIDILLKFVVKKINEEKSEILKVREAIKSLR